MAVRKKSIVKKAPSTKKPRVSATKPASIKILSATPSRDGAMWTLALTNGAKAKVSAAAAQSAGVRVGGAWSTAVAARVQSAADDQRLFLRAMQVLAKKGRTSASALSALLGGDARAKRTVSVLKKNGWIG